MSDLIDIPIGSDVKVGLSVSGGNVVITIVVGAQKPVDELLAFIKGKLPVSMQGVVDLIEKPIDAVLAAPAGAPGVPGAPAL